MRQNPYLARVENALSHAPTVRLSDVTGPKPYPDLSGFPHDYPVYQHATAIPPHAIPVELQAADELHSIFGAYTQLTGAILESEWIREQVAHEQQHAACMLRLGAQACVVGIKILKVESGPNQELFWAVHAFSQQVGTFETTRIGAASVAAHPVHPSESDISAVRQYGYAGVEELASAVAAHNKAVGVEIYPQPLSRAPLAR